VAKKIYPNNGGTQKLTQLIVHVSISTIQQGQI